MRFREFKTTLYEFAPPQAGQLDLASSLEQILNDTNPEDPIHQEAIKLLQHLENGSFQAGWEWY